MLGLELCILPRGEQRCWELGKAKGGAVPITGHLSGERGLGGVGGAGQGSPWELSRDIPLIASFIQG